MTEIMLIPFAEFERVRRGVNPVQRRLELLADMCRANTLASVKRAGSGHLGSSFSAMDIVTFLYEEEMNTVALGFDHPDRDVYFSSKGHDVPGQYAVLHAVGALSDRELMSLRRLRGTCGHPDVATVGMEANTGSLGMGISKGKGFAFAKRLSGHGGRVIVMTGDGELQEGQIYESLTSAPVQKLSDLTVIVDHNKLQSDKLVSEISDLGDIGQKVKAFGWHVARCDGHDFAELPKAFAALRAVTDRPKLLIADTIKGRGVSFMEHPAALRAGAGLYRWHSGAPDDASFEKAYSELVDRINRLLADVKLAPLNLERVAPEPRVGGTVTREYVAEAFGEALVEIGAERTDLVVLDADLAADCRIRSFEQAYPARFIENGIAEQDMVSMAGGLALQGLLPVVNTFASFLAARSNEQIYNNGCERTKVIYVCHYSGLIPAGPGQSHQSIRDISLLGSLPNFVIIQPCNAEETRLALAYAVHESRENCVLRLIIGPSPRSLSLPAGYSMVEGRGTIMREGSDAALFAYGPVMLAEALRAAEILAEADFKLRVINLPWLNRVQEDWLGEAVADVAAIYVLEDHSPVGGLGDFLLNALVKGSVLGDRPFRKFGVEGYPLWGTPAEVLEAHGLDGASLARAILPAAVLR